MPEEDFAKKQLGKTKKWSVMVYLAGGMDVSDEARESLLRMKQVGSTDDIHVIAQFDSGSEGTFTKRYYLSPLKDAVGIETLLRQACAEVSATLEPYDSTVGMDYCHRLEEVLSPSQRARFTRRQPAELVELLRYSPDRFKNFVLNCMLEEDVYPGPSGNLGDTNAGDLKTLVDFIRWAKVYYPAEHYMVVLWGHGSGLSVAWDYPSSPFVIGSGDALTAQELGKAFIDGNYGDVVENEKSRFMQETQNQPGEYRPGVDIVGFNSCSLGTIEVYRQLKGLVDFGIASEGFTPKTSWPYDKILEALAEDPDMAAETFADRIVEEYIAYYEKSVKMAQELQKIERKAMPLGANFDLNVALGYKKTNVDLGYKKTNVDLGYKKTNVDLGFKKTNVDLAQKKTNVDLGSQMEIARNGIDLSVCKLEMSGDVTEAMKLLVEKLLHKLQPGSYDRSVFVSILGAHAVSQSYFNRDFTDLFDFCRALRGFCTDRGILQSCKAVMDAIKGMCPNPGHMGDDVRNSHGVSIFFPWSEWGEDDVIVRYRSLDFLVETKWDEFLGVYRNIVSNFEKKEGVFSEALSVGVP